MNEHPCPWHGENCYSYDPSYLSGMKTLSDEWCDQVLREFGYDYRQDYSDEFRKAWLEKITNPLASKTETRE